MAVFELCEQGRLEELCLLPFAEASDEVAQTLLARAPFWNVNNILAGKEPNYYEVHRISYLYHSYWHYMICYHCRVRTPRVVTVF